MKVIKVPLRCVIESGFALGVVFRLTHHSLLYFRPQAIWTYRTDQAFFGNQLTESCSCTLTFSTIFQVFYAHPSLLPQLRCIINRHGLLIFTVSVSVNVRQKLTKNFGLNCLAKRYNKRLLRTPFCKSGAILLYISQREWNATVTSVTWWDVLKVKLIKEFSRDRMVLVSHFFITSEWALRNLSLVIIYFV